MLKTRDGGHSLGFLEPMATLIVGELGRVSTSIHAHWCLGFDSPRSNTSNSERYLAPKFRVSLGKIPFMVHKNRG